MTRDEGIEICIEALKENEDGSDEYFSLLEDLQKLKSLMRLDEEVITCQKKKLKKYS